MENGERWVHIREEEIDAFFDHLARQEAWRRRESRTTWRTIDTVQSIRNFRGERCLSLCFAQLADHFRSRPLWTLLLRDGVVCTG